MKNFQNGHKHLKNKGRKLPFLKQNNMSKSKQQFDHNLKKIKRQSKSDFNEQLIIASRLDRVWDSYMNQTFGKTNIY